MNTSTELSQSGRRVFNIDGHGGVNNMSINQRLLDGIDLNASHGGRRYEQHFDSDNPSMEQHYSSRPHYPPGSTSALAGNELRESLQGLKRSETENFKLHTVGVTFANNSGGYPRNHPLNAKVSGGGQLERIDENFNRSNMSRSPENTFKQGGVRSFSKGLEPALQSSNINDISQLTIKSNKLEDSVKDPQRVAMRIEGLTRFLEEEHRKRIGVYTKNPRELFNFWKDYVSSVYRQRRMEALARKNAKNSITGFQEKITLTQVDSGVPVNVETFQDKKHFDKNSKAYQFYEKLFELDVAYTIQKDIEDEQMQFKQEQLKQEARMKEMSQKEFDEREESKIRDILDAYYEELGLYLSSLPDYKPEIEDELLRKWHVSIAKDGKTPLSSTVTPSPKKDQSLTKGGRGASSNLEEIKEEPIAAEKKEDKQPPAKPDEQKKIDEKFNKTLQQEKEFIRNLFFMLRKMNVLSNQPRAIARVYRDQKEKQKFGVLWPKGDDDVEKMIFKFFRPERVLRRLLILYANRDGKFQHLSLFGFYLQFSQRNRQLFFIDWPVIKEKEYHSARPQSAAGPSSGNEVVPFKAKIDMENPEGQLKSLESLYNPDDYSRLSMEELCNKYTLYVKLLDKLQKDKEHHEFVKAQQEEREKLLVSVFGKERKLKMEQRLAAQKKRLNELAKPKDKWKRLRILLDLKKKFAHDMTLQKMINEELKTNRVFKYPEEYDLYDDQEDKLCKHMGEREIHVKGADDWKAGKDLRDKFKILDDQDLYYLKREVNSQRKKERELEQFLIQHALQYIQEKKKRLSGERTTVNQFVSKVYHEMVKAFPELAKARFPHITFGTSKKSETYKKSFPITFKIYFFRVTKSYFKTRQNKQQVARWMKNPPPAFIIGPGKRCLIHTEYACPDDCTYATFNKKVVLRSVAVKRVFREPHSFRARVWRRKDFKDALDKVLMLNSEQENCTFEPEAGSMSRTIDIALRANPNMKRDDILAEPDPAAYVEKLGSNFHKAHPEVYKAGILKRAKLLAKDGRYDDALQKLYDGFNVESIKKRYDPTYMRRFMAEALLKEKQKRLSKEREGSQGKTTGMSTLAKVYAMKDEPDSQKKRPEEDFENKKLVPILKEAFDLIESIENRKRETESKIKRIERQQSRMKKSLRSFSLYKRSQTRSDGPKPEKILFRSIMCPLREKCPRDMRPRWPTSNTKSITKFGEECPYAHHPMELRFPETIITKLSSSFQTIKNLKGKMDTEKPRDVFRPSGQLVDCAGCNSKSSKHIGGPCNMCRYKEMAQLQCGKMSDKKRMDSLRRSMERRVSKDEREDAAELHKIMKMLDLDGNYTTKFGLLKKACVLFFYGRYGDAFDEVAKAAKIIQDQREVEKLKQQIVEKRWKFKLGMDEGFELPLPIEQIDPNKVDEKFLKKLDLQGVAVATLKLFIQEVAPQGEYSKHQFLNKCIEDFYLQCEAELEDKQATIQKMKKQVEKLDEEADLLESYGGALSPDKPGAGEKRPKHKRLKMCPNLQASGKCSLPANRCPYAHNPIQLDLIPVETKMKNLQGVIQSQQQKLKNMKPLEPWRPVKSGEVIHTHLMDMTSKGRKKKGGDGEDDEDEEDGRRKEVKKKSIFDRENIFRKPYEVNE